MATAIGVVGSAITIFNFVVDLFPSPDVSQAKYRFKVGNNGASPPGGGGSLSQAGGSKPDIRAWDETFEFLDITTDGSFCAEGDTVCDSSIETREQPTYALFSANDDAICIAVVQTTFPSGDKYAVTLGNWAQYCSNYGNGIDHATWYWSDIYVKREDGGSDENVKCAWIDKNGDQPTTGIQIHWPKFDSTNGVQDSSNYCNDRQTIDWRTTDDPSGVVHYRRKRDMFASDSSLATSPAVRRSPDGEVEIEGRATDSTPVMKRGSSDQFSSQLVKSSLEEQTASELCNTGSSAGPSFVSYAERAFCYMPTKTQYSFCEDVNSGACWNDESNEVITKSGDGVALLSVDEVPAVNFTSTVVWDTKDLLD